MSVLINFYLDACCWRVYSQTSVVFAVCLTLLSMAWADVYLHQPRGSNDRLHEAQRERANGNRYELLGNRVYMRICVFQLCH
jgi:hypothetical protein